MGACQRDPACPTLSCNANIAADLHHASLSM
jgi:hypothetical protein